MAAGIHEDLFRALVRYIKKAQLCVFLVFIFEPIKKPMLDPWLGFIDAILNDDKQRGLQRQVSLFAFTANATLISLLSVNSPLLLDEGQQVRIYLIFVRRAQSMRSAGINLQR